MKRHKTKRNKSQKVVLKHDHSNTYSERRDGDNRQSDKNKEGKGKWLMKTRSLMGTILGLAGAYLTYNSFRPEIEITIGDSYDSRDAFESQIKITNNSLFSIDKIKTETRIDTTVYSEVVGDTKEFGPVNLSENMVTVNGYTHAFDDSIQSIKSKESVSMEIGDGFNTQRPTAYTDITVIVSYKYFGYGLKAYQRFKGFINRESKFVWYATPLEDEHK